MPSFNEFPITVANLKIIYSSKFSLIKFSTLIYKEDPKENYLIVCKNQTCSNKIKSIEELKSIVKNYAI